MATSLRDRFRLDGRVALVTGASKGIGASIARGLAEFGAAVVVSSRKQEAVEEVAQAIRAEGGQALAVAANVGTFPETLDLVDRTVAAFGGVDIVVNNAAANPVFGPIQDADERAYAKIMNVNVRGPLEICKRAYPSMKQRGGGSIINVASIGGLKPERGIGLYSASKAALINLSMGMAQDWGLDNVRVNVICPGLIKTRFSAALWGNEEILARFLQRIPLRRIGAPEDVAGLAVFLASGAAAYCTGSVYMVDGGYMAGE